MSAEVAERAKKELSTLNAGRAELMARLEDLLARGGANERILEDAADLQNSLRDHLEPSDHLTEVKCAQNSMLDLRASLSNFIKHRGTAGDDPGGLAPILAAVKELQARTRAFLEIR